MQRPFQTILPLVPLLLRSLVAQTYTIHDETFANGTWSSAIFGGTRVSAVSAFQSGGGISGNALNLQVTGSGTFTYDVQALMKNVSFKPSTQGTIDSIKWQTWYKAQGNTVATGYRALAMQGGSLFIANNTYFEPYNPSGWQYKNFNLSPANFTRLTGSGSSTLDISPGGADIFFGFLLSRGIFLSGTDNYAVSFFTVDVNYHPVLPVVTSSPMNLAIDSGGGLPPSRWLLSALCRLPPNVTAIT